MPLFVDKFQGWNPDADELNAPAGALLRADNTVMEQEGVVALRAGSAKINSPAYADLDVHSLFTLVLSGTKHRYAGAGSKVYHNHTALSTTYAGSGDIYFGAAFGQTFMARSTSKKKHDGTTERNWGLAMTGSTPTTAVIAPDSKTLATCASVESPGMVLVGTEGSTAFVADRNSTASAAVEMTPDSSTGRVSIEKDFAIDTDFSVYTGGQNGTDDDLLDFYVFLTEPEHLKRFRIMIDVNDGTFQEDFYQYDIEPETQVISTRDPGDIVADRFDIYGEERRRIREEMERNRPSVQIVRVDKPVGDEGWNHFQVARGLLTRHGNTAGKNWSTVRVVRLVLESETGGAAAAIRVDDIQLIGGHQSPLTGNYVYRYVYVYNEGDYQALSAPSAASAELEAAARGITVTIPVDGSHDTQINEIWVFRFGGFSDRFYRVGVVDSGHADWANWIANLAAINFADTTADVDAILTNVEMEPNNAIPPDNITGIAGPYYDRLFVLADGLLYPSEQLNPESYVAGNAIRVADDGEEAYFVALAFGGLYVGTSRDIYRIDGDGTDLGSGLLNFRKTALNIGNPPISQAFAQEGNSLAYLAEDGWRIITGGASQLLPTNLLYRGQARHGVNAVNMTGGRFRAALTRGIFSAITPEGASTTKSSVLHRYDVRRQVWYRHNYTTDFRSIYQEPDGTLIAGDDSGFMWQIDTGTQDDGADIAPAVYTPFLGGDTRKDPWHTRVKAEAPGSGAVGLAVDLHLDGSSSPASTTSMALSAGIQNYELDISSLGTFRVMQLRLFGPTSSFRLFSWQVDYRQLPTDLKFWEPKPKDPSPARRRFGGLSVLLEGEADITVVIDDSDVTTQSENNTDVQLSHVAITSQVGRDIWPKLAHANGFTPYDWTATILEEFPVQSKGLHPATSAGHLGVKEIGGMDFEICTLGVSATITPYFDGVADATRAFTIQTAADHIETVQQEFTTPVEAEDVAFSSDVTVEVRTFQPKVLQNYPKRIKYYELRPSKPCGNRNRFDGGLFTVNTEGNNVTVTPVLDGVDQSTITLNTNDFNCTKKTFDTLVGYDLWFKLTGTLGFLVMDVKPSILIAHPPTMKGYLPAESMEEGIKGVVAVEISACTFGVARVFTVYIDGTAQAETLTLSSSANDHDTDTLTFPTVREGVDIQVFVDGDIEPYFWKPKVIYVLPAERKVWDSGWPENQFDHYHWVDELRIKVKTPGNLSITPYFDDVAFAAQTLTVATADRNKVKVFRMSLPREFAGTVPRFVVKEASGAEFTPFWIEYYYRGTGRIRGKTPRRVRMVA